MQDKTSLPTGILMGLILSLPIGTMYALFTGAPFLGCITGSFFAATAAATLLDICDVKIKGIISITIMIRFCLTAYQALNKSLPLGGEDWWNYHNNALANIYRFNGIFEYLFLSKSDLFSRLIAVLYSTFGVHTMYINLFILSTYFIAAIYVYKLTLFITDYDVDASNVAVLFFSLWPIDIIYSVTYLREMPIQMLVIISFYHFFVYKRQKRISHLSLSFLFIIFACMMHSGVVAIIPVYLIFIFRDTNERFGRIFLLKNIGLIFMGILFIRVTPLWGIVSAKLGDVSSADKLITRAQQFDVVANTQYTSEMPTSLGGFILQMPIRAILFAVVPLPWMVHSWETVLSLLIDALPQLWFIYRMIKLNKMTQGTNKRVCYICFVLCLLGTYLVCGMGTSAYGNAIRHRAKIVPLVIAFTVGLYRHLRNQGNISAEYKG